MKKIVKLFLLLLMIIPIYIKADLQLRDYSSAVNRANGYINDYSDRNKYLMFNQKYEYINGSNTNNSSFTMGGMISKEEFELTKLKGSTYLEIGKEYWTLSTPSTNRNHKYYVDVTLRNKAETEKSGVRVTEFVKSAVNANGKGTYANPYTFEEGYLIDIRSNNPTYGKVNVSKTSVRPGESVDVTLVIANGYQYKPEKDNCGLTKITDTKYRLENINRDVTCTMIFERAIYKFTLGSGETYTSGPNPNAIYYVYQVGWFSNPNATSGIDNINPPTKTGYIFKGYSYRSTSVIDSTGAIVAGNNMQLASDDWLKTTINLTLEKEPITYTVAYNANGGAGTMGSVTHTYDIAKTLSSVNFAKPGYEFLKWNTKADGSGTSYTDKQSVVNLTSTQGATVTLYAQWTKCSAGTYSNNSTPRCTPCAAGKYSGAGSSSCTNCPAGKYAAGTGNTSCATCAAGTYSLAGAASCPACPSGYTSNAGTGAQNQCYISVSAGKYIGTANSATQTNCAAGTYKGAHTVNYGQTSSCSTCAAGTYSLAGAGACTTCPSGYTSAAGATAQNKCYISVTAGKYIATANSSTQTACAAGKYSSAHTVNYGSTSSCTNCSAGTYNTGTGNTSCTSCADGTYQASAGQTSCTNCPAGYEGTGTGKTSLANGCSICAAGKYSAAGASSCTNCPAGKYSASAGSSTCTNCAAGSTSSAGSSSCTTCVAGTYNTTAGSSSCATCPKGKYCTGGTNNTNCPAGKYSSAGASSCTNCPAGTYSASAGSSTCSTCAAGKYSGAGATGCTNCPAGKYSAAGASSCTNCPDGTYQGSTGQSSCTNCPAGYEGTGTGKTSQSNGCSKCTAGHYSASAGSASCSTCSDGTYQGSTGQTSCTKCPAGYQGTGTGKTSLANGCSKCNTLYYSASAGSASCTKCPNKTYNTGIGNTSCRACESVQCDCYQGPLNSQETYEINGCIYRYGSGCLEDSPDTCNKCYMCATLQN